MILEMGDVSHRALQAPKKSILYGGFDRLSTTLGIPKIDKYY